MWFKALCSSVGSKKKTTQPLSSRSLQPYREEAEEEEKEEKEEERRGRELHTQFIKMNRQITNQEKSSQNTYAEYYYTSTRWANFLKSDIISAFKNVAHWKLSYIPGRNENFQLQLILLFTVVTFYEVATNDELPNIELLLLEEQVSSSDVFINQSIHNLFYVCFYSKTPYLIYIVDLLVHNTITHA